MHETDKRSLLRTLQAIAEGYPVAGEQDRYIVVENPNHKEEWGTDPNLVIDVDALRYMVGIGMLD